MNLTLSDILNLITSIMFISLFLSHIIIYLGRIKIKKESYNIYFSFFTLFLAIFIIINTNFADKIIKSMHQLSGFIHFFRVLFASLFTYFGVKSINYIINLPNEKSKLFIPTYVFLILSLISTFSNILLGSEFYYKTGFKITMLMILCSIIYTVIQHTLWIIKTKSYRDKRVIIVIIGFVIPTIIIPFKVLFSILYFNLISGEIYIDLLISVFIFSYIISMRFNDEFLELINLKNTLESKVIERTKQLEEANQQKTNFFVNISHETKTPLTLISNYIEKDIIKRGSSDEMKIIKQNVDKLLTDIVNYLDYEKLEKGKIFYDHSQITDISMIIKDKLKLFKEIADKKEIIIEYNIDNNQYCKIDPYAFDRILNNLMDNAIKYTNNKGKIKVILKSQDNLTINLEIIDTGIGISEKELNNIFEPYYQVSHQKKNIQGIGMGLNIIKKIIDEIDGKIKIISKINQGSKFMILFKKYELNDNDTMIMNFNTSKPIDYIINPEIKKEVYIEDKNNILIVEDNLDMLNFLKESLNKKYNIFYAINGKEALNKIRNIKKPDIIISDIMMDIMDGYDFCENLFKFEKYRSIPLIFLTAKTKHEERIKGLKKGAIDFISKPFNIEELIIKIDSIIKVQNALMNKKLEEISDQLLKKLNIVPPKTYKDKLKILHDKYNISKRQLEITSLINEGLMSKEIAGKLQISKNTVDTHIKRIFEKLKIDSKIELIKILQSI